MDIDLDVKCFTKLKYILLTKQYCGFTIEKIIFLCYKFNSLNKTNDTDNEEYTKCLENLLYPVKKQGQLVRRLTGFTVKLIT